MSNKESVESIAEEARRELAEVSEESALEQWRATYLGRKGRLTRIGDEGLGCSHSRRPDPGPHTAGKGVKC